MPRGLICGVGITDEKTSNSCPFYSRWRGMIKRCYSVDPNRYGAYEGCQVAEEWLTFSKFKSWMMAQPWEGNHLDKDILSPGEKCYSPETSVFVPIWINTLLNDCRLRCGSLPTGVYQFRKRYVARVHRGHGSRLFLGSFESPGEAHKAWAIAKSSVIRKTVDRYRTTDRFDERICKALLDRANELITA